MQRRIVHSNPGWCKWLVSLMIASIAPAVQAQVIPDNTLGTGNNSITTTVGNRTDITGGLRRNSSLFHSFEQFNINTNQQVYFANPATVRNIFSRVTGGSLSNIDGLLGVAGSANLFLINPSGIIFGPNARLDISGSFFASTAAALMFPDGQRFAATGDRTVPLVEVNIPIGLQFGANPPAMIANRGILAAGQDLTLSADNLDLQGQLQAGSNLTLNATDTVKIRDTVTEPFISQAGNRLQVRGEQQVDIFALNHPDSIIMAVADLVLRSASPARGDAHFLAGGNFQIERLDGNLGSLTSPYDPVIRAAGDVSFASYDGNSLHILAGGRVTIPGSVRIQGNDSANGLDEDVSLTLPLAVGGTLTENIAIRGTSQPTLDIRAGTLAFGTPGLSPNPIPGATGAVNLTGATGSDITIGTIENNRLNARIFLTNQYNPNPALNNGAIRVTGAFAPPGLTETFSIAGYGVPVTIAARGDVEIARGIVTGSTGIPGGNIRIFSGGNINVSGGRLFSQTTASNSGDIRLEALGNIRQGNIDTRVLDDNTPGAFSINAGDVIITARGDITTATGNSIISRIDNIEQGRRGNGGRIAITSVNGSITNLGNVETSTPNGLGGTISLSANGRVAINTSVFSQVKAGGTGRGGDIRITSQNGDVSVTGFIESSTPQGDGTNTRHGGDITLRADGGSINVGAMRSFVGTSSPTGFTGGVGNAGTITLTASGGINLFGRTQSFTGTGNGGSIVFTANDTINVGPLRSFVGTILTDENRTVGGTGNAGNITLTSNNGEIRVGSSGGDTDISSFAGTGVSGNVTLTARNDITTRNISSFVGDSSATGQVTGGSGNPGRIRLESQQGGINTTQGTLSSAGPTLGADITLLAAQDIRTANAVTQATNQSGVARGGAINFTSTAGSITTTAGTLNAEGYFDGGSIRLEALGDVTTGRISSLSNGPVGFGGPISLTSTTGGINTLAGEVSSEGFLRGGDVLLTGNQDIRTADIVSRAAGQGGNVLLTSSNGSIITVQGTLNSQGGSSGGNVVLDARQSLTTGNIFSTSEGFSIGQGGDIYLIGRTGSVRIVDKTISSRASGNANGGNIAIVSNGLLEIAGNSLVTAETDGRSSGTIALQSNGGDIILNGNNTSERGIRTTVKARATGSGSDITIDSNGGQISLNNGFTINSATATQAAPGTGGSIRINSQGGRITVDGNSTIDASTSGVQTGGNVSVLSGNQTIQLNSGSIRTTVFSPTFDPINPNQLSGNGGSITIHSGGSDITLGNPTATTATAFQIDAQTQATNTIGTRQQNGVGGNVLVDSRGGAVAVVAGSGINAGTTGAKDSGTVTIQAGNNNITLDNGTISTSSIAALDNNSGAARSISLSGQTVTLGNASSILATSNQGIAGSIQVGAQTLSLDGNSRIAATTQSREAGNVIVNATNAVNLNNNSLLSVAATAAGGSAGDILVATPQLTVENGATISASSVSSQSGGEINLALNTLQLNNGRIAAETQTGRAGNVTVNATSGASLANNSVLSVAATATSGTAGDIFVTVPQLTAENGATITASNIDAAVGGNITLANLNTLGVTNSLISSSTQSGQAGNIFINRNQPPAQSIQLSGVGNFDLNANNTIEPNEVVGGILATAISGGSAGSININTLDLVIDQRASVGVSSTNGRGTAGNVDITANTVSLNNGAQISAETDAGGVNSPANITLQGLQSLTVTNSLISSSTRSGTAGAVTVNAANQITLDGTSSRFVDREGNARGGIIAEATQGGNAGDITLTVGAPGQRNTNGWLTPRDLINGQSGQLSILNGAEISVSSPEGRAGNLAIDANALRLDRGTISATTGTPQNASLGDGGSIRLGIDRSGLLLMENGSRIIANATPSNSNVSLSGGNITIGGREQLPNGQVSQGAWLIMRTRSRIEANAKDGANGGNIIINTPFIIGLTFENSDIVANAEQGRGGRIDITTNAIFGLRFRPKETALSDITASSEFGFSGNVILKTIDTDVTRGLSTPAIVFTDVSRLTTSACEAVGAKATTNSELRIYGRGGIPLSPTAPLPAQTASSDWVSLDVTPEIPTTVTFFNGKSVTLEAGQTYQVQASCVKSWQNQQRPTL